MSLFNTYSDLKLLAAESFIVSSPEINNVEDMVKCALNNEKLSCKALLEAENGGVLREKLMPQVLEKLRTFC